MTVNELDSRVAVVHRCFSEIGDSILSLCERSCKITNKFLWLAGCAYSDALVIEPAAPQSGLYIATCSQQYKISR